MPDCGSLPGSLGALLVCVPARPERPHFSLRSGSHWRWERTQPALMALLPDPSTKTKNLQREKAAEARSGTRLCAFPMVLAFQCLGKHPKEDVGQERQSCHSHGKLSGRLNGLNGWTHLFDARKHPSASHCPSVTGKWLRRQEHFKGSWNTGLF